MALGALNDLSLAYLFNLTSCHFHLFSILLYTGFLTVVKKHIKSFLYKFWRSIKTLTFMLRGYSLAYKTKFSVYSIDFQFLYHFLVQWNKHFWTSHIPNLWDCNLGFTLKKYSWVSPQAQFNLNFWNPNKTDLKKKELSHFELSLIIAAHSNIMLFQFWLFSLKFGFEIIAGTDFFFNDKIQSLLLMSSQFQILQPYPSCLLFHAPILICPPHPYTKPYHCSSAWNPILLLLFWNLTNKYIFSYVRCSVLFCHSLSKKQGHYP